MKVMVFEAPVKIRFLLKLEKMPKIDLGTQGNKWRSEKEFTRFRFNVRRHPTTGHLKQQITDMELLTLKLIGIGLNILYWSELCSTLGRQS